MFFGHEDVGKGNKGEISIMRKVEGMCFASLEVKE